MYVSGQSLIRGYKTSLAFNEHAPVLPVENMFLGDTDGITEPCRILPNTTTTTPLHPHIYFELWAEFSDKPGLASHLFMGDISVSEQATWLNTYYGKHDVFVDWDESGLGLLGTEQSKLIFVEFPESIGTVTWFADHVQLTNWSGYIFVNTANVANYIPNDGRYWGSWKIISESPYLPGISWANRVEDPFTIILTKYNDQISAGVTNNEGLKLTIPGDGASGWTGKIYGFNFRKQLNPTWTERRLMIGPQAIPDTGVEYQVYRYEPNRGQNELYPINAVDFFDAAEVQAVIINIDDPDKNVLAWDCHYIHLGGGYKMPTPKGVKYSPVIPKITTVDETGFSVPQEGVPVRRFSFPLKFLGWAFGTELHRMLASAIGKPIVVSAWEESNGAIFQFWTALCYIEETDFKNDGVIWDGSLELVEIRVSYNQ